MKKREWTEHEESFMTENYTKLGCKEVARILDIRYTLVARKAINMGLSKKNNREWSDCDVTYLKRYYGKMAMNSLCKKLDRSRSAIVNKAFSLDIVKKKCQDEDAFLIDDQKKADTFLPNADYHARLNKYNQDKQKIEELHESIAKRFDSKLLHEMHALEARCISFESRYKIRSW